MSDKENTQYKESLTAKLEQIKTIANQVKTSNILSAIINILDEVKQWLDRNNAYDINYINAKLDDAYHMVTVHSDIISQAQVNDNDASEFFIFVEVEQAKSELSKEQIAQIMKMSSKLYDIFTKHGGLLQEIFNIFANKEKPEDINQKQEDLEKVINKLVEAQKEKQYCEEIEEIKEIRACLEQAVKDNNIFIDAVHATVVATVVHAAVHSAVHDARHAVVQQAGKDVTTGLSSEEEGEAVKEKVPNPSPSDPQLSRDNIQVTRNF